MKKITITLDLDTDRLLGTIATERGMSKTDLAKRIITEEIRKIALSKGLLKTQII